MKKGHTIDRRAALAAHTFGSLIRSRRQALAMSQDQLALATGVGRRFLIELEAGKATCHLGRSLVIAQALGLHAAQPTSDEASLPALDLPDIPGDDDG
jgi:transcriptional regulator with XRE-family HTH domain